MVNNKFFILVLYKCDLNESKSYLSLIKSLEAQNEKVHLFIYDNSPKSQTIIKDNSVWSEINYVHDPFNSGLSIAYNTGAKLATSLGFKWIGLFDQDTEFPSGYIGAINRSIEHHPKIALFAPIIILKSGVSLSPTRYKYKRGYKANLAYGIHSLNKYSPINSGIIINLDAFNDVGGYIDQIKLDFSDFQFMEKFRVNYPDFYLIDSIAIQDFSNDDPDINSVIFRFKIFLDCAKRCQRKTFKDDLQYFYSVSRHTLGLTLKFKDVRFIKLFYFKYIKNAG